MRRLGRTGRRLEEEELQVGQTGRIISPELYFATSISDAIQRLNDIEDAGTIVVINKNGVALIFEIAEIGLVDDLFQLPPELAELTS